MPFVFDEEAVLTNEQLAGELAKLTPLTADEIDQLLPRRIDKERFGELIKLVASGTSQQNKLASLQTNLATLGPVVLKVLGKVLKLV